MYRKAMNNTFLCIYSIMAGWGSRLVGKHLLDASPAETFMMFLAGMAVYLLIYIAMSINND
jgi:hypothetical protein